ncbi:MAG: DUF2851 family protein [Paludibacter sp.]|nr:DUF2851 family protein [Paludibacter sp.]
MKESILHYIWQQKLFVSHGMMTTDGEPVEVIDVGKLNTDAGPDFFNAKIKVGETLWAGNVEIHLNSSDWNKHNHDSDKAYDSVILHVVKNADAEVFRFDGEKIPQLELIYSNTIEKNYEQLIHDQKWIPCSDKIMSVPNIFIQSWKNTLLVERLEQKMETIESLLNTNNQHWEEAFYITLARNFGFGTNSQAFEQLAKVTPLSVLGKHKDNLFQLEAILFGRAGLLDLSSNDDYVLKLRKEYAFFVAKFDLKPINSIQWKLLRLRPDNFPHIRIAQFAALIYSSTKLFSKILEKPELDYMNDIFECNPSEYWQTHYTFSSESKKKEKKLGQASKNVIYINTVIPFLFCYAQHKNNQELKDRVMELLERIPAEQNSIVTGWKNIGLDIKTAYDSQAFLQLKKNYCDDKKCLRCRIGNKVLTMSLND